MLPVIVARQPLFYPEKVEFQIDRLPELNSKSDVTHLGKITNGPKMYENFPEKWVKLSVRPEQSRGDPLRPYSII